MSVRDNQRRSDSLLVAFGRHLARTRGTHPLVQYNYARYVRMYIDSAFRRRRFDVGACSAASLAEFVSTLAERYRPSTVQIAVNGLRAFFRYLRAEGLRSDRLEDSVPSVPRPRLATIPLHLDEPTLRRLVASLKPLRAWLAQLGPDPQAPVCPNHVAKRLSSSGVQRRLQAAVRKAMVTCPSLRARRIAPHTFRHTTAMHLLQAGVDLTVIALWLGHEDPATTHGYLEADLAMKRPALERLKSPAQRRARFKPTDRILSFLEGL